MVTDILNNPTVGRAWSAMTCLSSSSRKAGDAALIGGGRTSANDVHGRSPATKRVQPTT